ncbi:MAG: SurA N-terminal domain-containing protein [Gammaproteobacteria bacterium]|nr:SurA N-terminal domain-containing protein [Gammaproteobacteria bacterium]
MLTAIRERATGWIAWVIVTLIAIPFALWGINSYFEGGSDAPVALVDGEEISTYAYQEELVARRQMLANQLGENFDPELLDSLEIRQTVVEALVENLVLRQYAEAMNYRISDDQLMALIQSVPVFQEEGSFDQGRYLDVLAANRLTPQEFELSQRASGVVDQLRNGLDESAFFTRAERDRVLALWGQSRKVDYATIDTGRFVGDFILDDDEIEAYYQSNIGVFQNEASIQVDYIELSIDALAESIQPDDAEILAHYEETKGRYRQPETRKASHILIAVAESSGEEQRQEKLERAREISQRARSGEDFGELALQHSDDPGSSINGGDLGVIARGQMVRPFEDAVFAMSQGEISQPVESPYGFHVIYLTGVEEEHQQPLEEVRTQVETDLSKVQAENTFADLAESFKNLVFEAPEDIQVSANELDLPVHTSGWFTARSGEGIAENRDVRQAAFSEDVLSDNLVSQAIEIGFDKLIAVQKVDYREAHPQSFESVRQEIVASLKREKSRAKVLQMGSDLLGELESRSQNAQSWSRFILDQGLEIESLPEARQEIPAALRTLGDTVYALGAPAPDSIKFGGLALESGDYVLYSLEEVIPGELDRMEESERNLVEQQLLSRDGPGYFDQFSRSLREFADVVIYDEQL